MRAPSYLVPICICTRGCGRAALAALVAAGEAQETVSWLTATCMLFVGVGFHYGCSEQLLERWCPKGTVHVIRDTMDPTKTVDINCTWLHTIICAGGAVGAVEVMRNACGWVP